MAITVIGIFCASSGHSEFEECSKKQVEVQEAEFYLGERKELEACCQDKGLYDVHPSTTSVLSFLDRFFVVQNERSRFNGTGTYLLI